MPGCALGQHDVDLDDGAMAVRVGELQGVGLRMFGSVAVAEGVCGASEFLDAARTPRAGDVVDGGGEEVDPEVRGGGGGDVAEVDKVWLGGGRADRGEDEEDGRVGGGHDAGVVALEGDGGVRGEVVRAGEVAGERSEGQQEADGLEEEGH